MAPSNRQWIFGVMLLFLIAVWLVRGIHSAYLHPDEQLVFHYTRFDWVGDTVSLLANTDTHPPLWFSFFWLWRHLTGETEFTGRLQAVFFTMLALALLYPLGRRWFGAPRYGLYAMAVLAVNAFFFNYALEIRPYGAVMFLATLSMWAFQRWLTRRTWRSALLYAATLPAMLYVHYFLVFVILAQGVYALFVQQPARQLVRQIPGMAGLALALWVPWFPSFVSQIIRLKEAEIAGNNARGVIGAGSTTLVTSAETIGKLVELLGNGQILVVIFYAMVLLGGAAYLWRTKGYRLALLWALGVPALSLAANTVIAVYTPRYVLALVMGLGVALGAALASFPERVRVLPLLAVIGLSLWAFPDGLELARPHRVPYRELYQRMSALAKPGDAVLFQRAEERSNYGQWLTRHYISPELQSNTINDVEEVLSARRVWFVTGDLYHDSVQEMFQQIERSHPLQTVLGECTRRWCYVIQLLEAPPWDDARTFGEEIGFRGLDLDRVTRQTIETRLWWQVDHPPQRDYSIGLHLIDSNGVLVNQSDGPIHYGDGTVVQTSQLQPGQIYIDYRTLSLSPEMAAGEYQLALVVYQSWDNVRLTVPEAGDMLVLDNVVIP